jgi:hypothetical protein
MEIRVQELEETVRELRASLQDQTDLLNKSEAKRRILESMIKAKDAKHTETVTSLRHEVTVLTDRLAEVTEGKGVVPMEAFEKQAEAHAKTLLKLEATKKYAENLRRAALPVPPGTALSVIDTVAPQEN